MSEAPIIFQELPAGSGKIGRVTLNVAATLNSLTLEMVDLLQGKLDAWRDDGALIKKLRDAQEDGSTRA